MTSQTLSRLPLAAGGLVMDGVGRIALWALHRFAQAPATYLATFALVTGAALAASNALYFQPGMHPAPLFGAPALPGAEAEPRAVPIIRQTVEGNPDLRVDLGNNTQTAVEDTGPATVEVPASRAIGNEDVAQVQQKLLELKLFEGTVDGYYGPKTARAIRAFEMQAGMTPRGELRPEVIDAILRAPMAAVPAQAQPALQNLVEPQRRDAQVQDLPAPQPVAEQPVLRQALAQPEVAQPQLLQASLPAPARGAPQAETAAAQASSRTALTPPATTVAAADPTPVSEPVDVIGSALASVMQGAANMIPAQIGSRQVPQVEAPVRQAAVDMPQSATDPELVMKVQRGLASLGFLTGAIDGVPGEGTGRAIRNFEVYHNYKVTGRITPELVNMLLQAGAVL